jgi:TldD protein
MKIDQTIIEKAYHFDTANEALLAPSSLDAQAVQSVLSGIMSHQVDYADLYFQYSRSESWGLEEGQVKSGAFAIDQGVGVRAVSGEKTAFAYSDEINLPALEQAAKATKAIASIGESQTANKIITPEAKSLYLPHDPIASLTAEAKVKLLERLEQFAKQIDPRVTQVMASIAGEYEVVLVARSDGVMAADIRPLVRISVQVIAEQNGRREQGTSGGGGRYDYSYFSDDKLQSYAQKAVHQALVNLDARPAPAGSMTVVLGAGWPGILLHEAIGHGLEGDFNRKGSSAFSGMIGQQVAAKGITIVDDGTIANRRGSLSIDDEGNPTNKTVLIEDGILRGYIQDTLNARLMDMPVTGNARRESYAHIPMPRMTNTYMHNGDKDPQEIIQSVK